MRTPVFLKVALVCHNLPGRSSENSRRRGLDESLGAAKIMAKPNDALIMNPMMRHIRILLVLSLLTFGLSSEAARYKYSELQIKDYDEMLALVKTRVKKATKLFRANQDEDTPPDQQGVEELREALHLILSRPNQDNMLAKLLPDVRKEMANVNAFEDNMASLVSEAIDGLNNDKIPTVHRSTYLIVLENILSEFKPEVRDKEDLRQLFEKIRDAKLKIPKEVTKDLKLRSMLSTESPSERAKRILDGLNPKKK
ncbi:MAG: hypothetical protein AB7N80_01725 [Bdellovibrionales bacterium]